jgi:hypothetical protein
MSRTQYRVSRLSSVCFEKNVLVKAVRSPSRRLRASVHHEVNSNEFDVWSLPRRPPPASLIRR